MLVESFRKGDNWAFEEIYSRYDKLLYIYAYKKLNDRETAKDVVQEVFLKLLDNRISFVLKTTLASYLYRAVLNRILDIFKHNDVIRRHIEAGNHYVTISEERSDYLIRENDIKRLIAREIENMPPRMREIYELKRNAYLSTKEIAARLNISEDTVATQLKRAKRHLKERLKPTNYFFLLLANFI